MSLSAAISTPLHVDAARHLLRSDRQEDLCFGLWNISAGEFRTTALIHELLLPQPGERRVHGNASFLPHYLERAIQTARQKECGLAFLHSHPSDGWQGMSADDVRAEAGIAPAAFGSTGLPLVGLTIGTDEAWSARWWERIAPRTYDRRWCASVRVVGDRFCVTFHDEQFPDFTATEEMKRTISAWGESAQESFSRLSIGIVGAGSVGALVAETLARMGVGRIGLIDFDSLEAVNMDRLLHATRNDVGRAKVAVLAEKLKGSATAKGFRVEPREYSIVEEAGMKCALDYDILFSCVDRPWPRFALNQIAYAHLIPVIDGGIMLEANSTLTGLKRGTWRAHIAAPTRRCLECLEQFDSGDVAMERDGHLDDSNYIAGLPKGHRLKSRENVFAASLSVASMEINQFLRMILPHPGHANIGAETYHFVPGNLDRDERPCEPYCTYPEIIAKGDRAGFSATGVHVVAERARARRATSLPPIKREAKQKTIWERLLSLVGHSRPTRGAKL